MSAASPWVDHTTRAMGGALHLRVVLATPPAIAVRHALETLLADAAARIERWASRVTRYAPSELTRLNADPSAEVVVGPTLAALLTWGAEAGRRTDSIVDITMLRARLDAETGRTPHLSVTRSWSLTGTTRRTAAGTLLTGGRVSRDPGVTFDLDGVAKGWIADRAARLLVSALERHGVDWRSCHVAADGDVALAHRAGVTSEVCIELPDRTPLGTLRLSGARAGVATSGTGIHRWGGRHHLIDPRTGASSASGIAQATVVTESARLAEAWAKTIVIAGNPAIRAAERAGITTMVVVTEDGAVLSTPAVPLPIAPISFTPVALR